MVDLLCNGLSTFLDARPRGISLVLRLCPKRYAAVMSLADTFLKEEDEAPDAGDCMGKPYECHRERCQAWLIDIEVDREFDERKDAA